MRVRSEVASRNGKGGEGERVRRVDSKGSTLPEKTKCVETILVNASCAVATDSNRKCFFPRLVVLWSDFAAESYTLRGNYACKGAAAVWSRRFASTRVDETTREALCRFTLRLLLTLMHTCSRTVFLTGRVAFMRSVIISPFFHSP